MADELLTKVEKQMEGTNLALAAVAEVLQKMDARFAYDEEAQIRKEENDAALSERTMLVKEIASEVVGILKQDMGMDVDGSKVRSAAKSGASHDDTEKPAKVSTKIEDQQATIQAMRKQEEEEEDEEETTKGGYMKTHDPEDDEDEDMEKEGANEYPAKEAEPEIFEEEEEKSMQKQLITLRKQLSGFKNDMDSRIQNETENRLRKMGFREENGLQKPQRIDRNAAPIGTDGTTFIAKSAQSQDEVVDQLASLSYKQLRDMQVAIQQGETEGIPRELLG